MARDKHKDLTVSDFGSYSVISYTKLFNAFYDIHKDALKTFRKLTLQKKVISNLKEEVLKDVHASLVMIKFVLLKL